MSRGLALLLMVAGFSFTAAHSADDVISPGRPSPGPAVATPGPSAFDASDIPRRQNADALPNLVRLTDRLFSGGTPEGEKGFDALTHLGVRTVISVDGASPQVGLAGAVGIRYVHLPIGYDGISQQRSLELAKAVRDLPGPIYVHCHHGRHRAPVAASVAAVALRWLDARQASLAMQVAGTGAEYHGLRASVTDARPVSAAELDSLLVAFAEKAPVATMARSMVELERRFASLAESDAGRASRAEEILLLEEAVIEVGRLKQSEAFGSDFQARVDRARTLTERLGKASDVKSSRLLLRQLKQQCTSCHARYRDR